MKDFFESLPGALWITFGLLLGWFLFSIYYLILAYRKPTSKYFNPYIFESIPQIFTTLGIFGTFLGIAVGLWKFDVKKIEDSIPE